MPSFSILVARQVGQRTNALRLRHRPKRIRSTGNSVGVTTAHAVKDEHEEQLKLAVLDTIDAFPVTLRQTIDETREEDAGAFLTIVEGELVRLLYGNEGRGLDCNRDTEEEVETAIYFFPHVLCERYWGTHPPIYAQLAYLKSVPFVPLLARLGIELNQFQTEEQGGLFYRKWNVLRSLVNDDWNNWYDKEDRNLVDEMYFFVMKALQQLVIFQKGDVRRHRLMRALAYSNSFSERWFRCLVDLDPNCCKEYYGSTNYYGNPHESVYKFASKENGISAFRTIFELGMTHYPTELGFLFHRHCYGRTNFELVCCEFGADTVSRIVEDALRIWDEREFDASGKLVDRRKTMALIHAATNSGHHFEAVYFLLRRDPAVIFYSIAKG